MKILEANPFPFMKSVPYVWRDLCVSREARHPEVVPINVMA